MYTARTAQAHSGSKNAFVACVDFALNGILVTNLEDFVKCHSLDSITVGDAHCRRGHHSARHRERQISRQGAIGFASAMLIHSVERSRGCSVEAVGEFLASFAPVPLTGASYSMYARTSWRTTHSLTAALHIPTQECDARTSCSSIAHLAASGSIRTGNWPTTSRASQFQSPRGCQKRKFKRSTVSVGSVAAAASSAFESSSTTTLEGLPRRIWALRRLSAASTARSGREGARFWSRSRFRRVFASPRTHREKVPGQCSKASARRLLQHKDSGSCLRSFLYAGVW